MPGDRIEMKKAAFRIDKRPVLIYFNWVKRFKVQRCLGLKSGQSDQKSNFDPVNFPKKYSLDD
jgi:hypothetical protein